MGFKISVIKVNWEFYSMVVRFYKGMKLVSCLECFVRLEDLTEF